MPVPTTVADLDPVAANNYPVGSESVGPNLDNYLRAHAAIIRQVSDSIAPAIAATVPAGVILIWSGSAAAIPAGWKLCDGTNSTPNLVDKFVLGASASSPAVGANGGASTVTLNTNQIPSHAHAISDVGHAHGVSQSSHSHGVNDPSHSHTVWYNTGGPNPNGFGGPIASGGATTTTANSATGISIQANTIGISVNTAGTGISIQNTGSGQAHENMPPYYALCYIQKA